MTKRYFIGKLPNTDKLATYQPITSILDWYIFTLDSTDVPGIESLCERTVEMDKEMGFFGCLLYTSPSPRDRTRSRMPSSA